MAGHRAVRICAFFTGIAALLAAGTVAAQPTPIAVGAGAVWSQDEAGVQIRPEVAGFERTALVDFGERRLNVGATYMDRASQTTATLYLFRAPVPDVSIWHERALLAIQPHPQLGRPNPAAALTASFAPRTGGVASGLRTVVPLTGTDYRSTGVAVFPVNEWLVKVRMSSRTLDPAALAERLDALITGLSYVERAVPQIAAPMAACPRPLAFEQAARAEAPPLAAQLVLPMLANARLSATEPATVPDKFCRDAASQLQFGVYRRGGADDAYVLAIADAGASVGVHRFTLGDLIPAEASSDFLVELATPDALALFRGFRTLPAPAQIIQLLESERPVSTYSRGEDGKPVLNVSMPRDGATTPAP